MNKQIDGKAFAEMIMAAGEMYNKKISGALIDMLFADLESFSIDQVRKAFAAHRSDPVHGRFFPITADFTKHIVGMPTDLAQGAWMKVYNAIKSQGSYQTVVFDDKAIHAAIASMGGWIKLCSKTEDEMSFAQKDFVRLYSSASKDPQILVSAPRFLLGEYMQHNNKLGEEPKASEISYIGNREQCLLVLKSQQPNSMPVLMNGAKVKKMPS